MCLGSAFSLECLGPECVSPRQYQTVEGCVELGRQAEAPDRRDRATVAFVSLEPDAPKQVARDHASCAAGGAQLAALAAQSQQFVVPAPAAAQPLEALVQDAALEEGVELVLDEPRQLGATARFGVGHEAGRVRLHQAAQRGLSGKRTPLQARDQPPDAHRRATGSGRGAVARGPACTALPGRRPSPQAATSSASSPRFFNRGCTVGARPRKAA